MITGQSATLHRTARHTRAARGARRAMADAITGLLCLLLLSLSLTTQCVALAGNADGGPERDDYLPRDTDRAPDYEEPANGNSDARDGVLLHQMLSGREIAKRDQRATGMKNFQYFVGEPESRKVVVVDGAWDPQGLESEARDMGVEIVGYVATHYHWDHIGDAKKGVLGMKYFVDREDYDGSAPGVPAYVHEIELSDAASRCGIVRSDRLLPTTNGTTVWVGRVRLRFVHTPGHSRGGMSIAVGRGESEGQPGEGFSEQFVLTGDTLFPGSCGRIDLPESNKADMYRSLQNVLREMPEAMVVWPGHGYGAGSTTIGKEKKRGLLRKTSEQQWKRQMGGY